jgi:hypothetical protein
MHRAGLTIKKGLARMSHRRKSSGLIPSGRTALGSASADCARSSRASVAPREGRQEQGGQPEPG